MSHVPHKNDQIAVTDAAGKARRRAKRRKFAKGYQISQRVRKRVEEIIGWLKTVRGLARARFVGRWKIEQQKLIAASAYNLLRIVRFGDGDIEMFCGGEATERTKRS